MGGVSKDSMISCQKHYMGGSNLQQHAHAMHIAVMSLLQAKHIIDSFACVICNHMLAMHKLKDL